MENKRATPTVGKRTDHRIHQAWTPESTEILRNIGDLSAELWREVDMERIVNRFVEQLNRTIGLTRAALFDYQTDPQGRAKLSLSDLKVRRDRLLAKDAYEPAIARIESTVGTESTDGVRELHIDDQVFHLILLGDAQIQRWVLLLKVESSKDRESESAVAVLEFIGRQLQLASVWSCRLDNTQSQLYRDDLTGLYNTRYMEETLEKEVRRAIRFGTRFCVFFVDLDNLKEVNDRHGHLAGSSILKQFAEILRVELREVDSIIRYGGDEYIVLLLGATANVGEIVAERLRKRIDQHQFLVDGGSQLHLTCSIGVAAFPEHGKTKDELLKNADESMYRGKRTGKNQVIMANPIPDASADISRRSH